MKHKKLQHLFEPSQKNIKRSKGATIHFVATH